MNPKSSSRSTRPLPVDYNKINDMDNRPKRERRKKKFNYTKIIAVISIILLSLLIVCLYYLSQKDIQYVHIYEKQHCMKKDCLLSASFMIKSMDNSFYPCDDFFLYSCGDSLHSERQTKHNFLKQIQYKHEMDLKNSIEALNDDKQPNYIRKVYKYYKSCLNEAMIEKQDINPLNKLIDRLGGWPVVKRSHWPTDTLHYHWINTYIMMRKIGIKADSLFKLRIEKDVRNASHFIAYVDQPEFGLTRESLNDSQQYFNLMVTIAEMMGADKIDAQNDLLDVIVFEKELIQLSLSEADHQNNTYYNNNYMTVRQMQMFAPNIDWVQFFTEFIGKPIDTKMEIIVLIPTYIRKLNQKLLQTDSRVLANYLIWKVIYKHIPLLSKRWREPVDKYLRNNVEDYKKEERWMTCLRQIHDLMPYPLGNIYMKKHFNKRKDIEVISMINNIRESFIALVDKNEWMSDLVRVRAKEKILLLKLGIGFPKELLSEDLMDSWLKNVDIEQDYFTNTVTLSLFSIDEQMKNLFNSTDNMEMSWLNLVNPADIVLKYSPEDNTLLISAALINGYFNEDLPKYLNYGSLGLLISQQMVKVYDEIGRLYDDSGTHGKWWDKLTERNLDNYLQCYEKQIKDLDDVSTQMSDKERYSFIGQLITDNTVFRQTILAYRAYVHQENSQELCLVGLNHTSEQLFWINSANTYLNVYKDIDSSYDIIKYRINSMLSNIKEFSEAFNCSSVSTMNSPIKC